MQFTGVSADLHNFCACAKRTDENAVQDFYWTFDDKVTKYACDRYLARNTGNKEWDQCKDCRMDVQTMDLNRGTPSCFSPGYHMGGDEFDYYCGLRGLQGYCKSIGAKQG
ncbi:hypothetical protein N0V93_002126 [Gnomoniopsis smithogilvyi]|uniref:Uncharacterized protein n=1 Tax=Gnomoniopsis smithogilvyi TaxID=1191159 RepID=A0A9W8Z535_9PEZI|nr:hypothetical protein N0V93_002126 [Gnomoniopsis smithogilvyi]